MAAKANPAVMNIDMAAERLPLSAPWPSPSEHPHVIAKSAVETFVKSERVPFKSPMTKTYIYIMQNILEPQQRKPPPIYIYIYIYQDAGGPAEQGQDE